MLDLAGIVFGAALTLGACCSLGSVLLKRSSLPACVMLAAGAAVLSHIIFVILL
ncbi:MAG: hypothetical protein GY953_42780, partial [bacterium]|nr:hypothetical protein [bacterium]